MVDDFYSEEEQWERVKQWLRENGPWLLLGVVLGLGALGGWRWWQERVEQQALTASATYSQILEAFERGDRTRGMSLIDDLRRDHDSSPYADQADLLAARSLVEESELGKAVERLTRVMNKSRDEQLRLVARLRLARVQLAQGNPDIAMATLDGAAPGAFAARFEEIRGDVLDAKGDKPAAVRAWRKALETDVDGSVDRRAVDLKITDLLADGIVADDAPPAAAAPPTETPAAQAAAPVAAP
ncbi:MAG: tetratricopeptide repeat protein [Sinobacteraceae bacterium]|nr:tetratricopeptide repeat protein [Nevskiaceae bacterium]MCP5472812.1 tetratricopeptide repeat protein [Nevskiaceae bacterium]